jgi:hypothetical protein
VGVRPSERDNGGWWRVGQAAACRALRRTGPRNVRTPPGTVLGNTQSGRPAGKCHREQTADGGTGLRSGPAQVRVKRCGKSAPAPGATRAARQTPSGARPRRGRTARPQRPPGRPLEPAGNRRPRGMAATDGSPEPSGQNPAYRPTRHHHRSDLRRVRRQKSSSSSSQGPGSRRGRRESRSCLRVSRLPFLPAGSPALGRRGLPRELSIVSTRGQADAHRGHPAESPPLHV